MTAIDYRHLFAEAMRLEMEDTFTAHGIGSITEDELEEIVSECYRACYRDSIRELRRTHGLSVFGSRTRWM